jgi:hypothetical protein
MLDVLLCYGFAANMIRAGYFGLVADFFRQLWVACRWLGAAIAAGIRRLSRGRAARLRRVNEITLRRLARLETYVTSMT